MAEPLKILTLSAEVAPFAKTGGLADVAGALPKALRTLGHEVRVVLPAYQAIEDGFEKLGLRPMAGTLNVPTGAGVVSAGVFEGVLPGTDVAVYFVAERSLFYRPNIYGYEDDAYRFAFYCRAALELLLALDWRPDVVHAHDWHAAPAVTWLATAGQASEHFRGIPTVFTIHNLAHQGRARWEIFEYLGLLTHKLTDEAYGEVNFMARGIYHATLVNTVSPTYAREIRTPEFGAYLDGLLRFREFDLHGILNGLDTEVWNPATDPNLARPYDAGSLEGKATNKRALQARLGLPQRVEVPLVAIVSRLDYQKGIDLLGEVVHRLLNNFVGEAQFVVLGSGAHEYEAMFARLAGYHKEKMTAIFDYAPDLAPLIYAGSDIFLMPSRFEPCGLGQLIAMRYGSVPVVRATGGLVDTVADGVSGFCFEEFSVEAFWHALERALDTYRYDRERWRAIQTAGMTADYSWENSAKQYEQLYRWALSRMRGW